MSLTRPEGATDADMFAPPSARVIPAESPAAAPGGWYVDPRHQAPWRWWDGNQWTEYIQSAQGSVWHVAQPSRSPHEDIQGPSIRGGGIAALGAVIGVVASILLQVVYLITTPRPWNINAPWLVATSEVLLWTGFIGAVIIASRRHGTGRLSADYGFHVPRPKDVGIGFVGGVVAGVVPILLAVLAIWATTGFKSAHGTATKIAGIKPEGTAGWIVVILLVVVGAPIIEELFFRGLVQGAFMRRIGSTSAIFVTALIFCACHTLNEGPIAPMILFAPALVLGYLRVRTQRLAAGMVAHATFNGLTLCLLLIPALR